MMQLWMHHSFKVYRFQLQIFVGMWEKAGIRMYNALFNGVKINKKGTNAMRMTWNEIIIKFRKRTFDLKDK